MKYLFKISLLLVLGSLVISACQREVKPQKKVSRELNTQSKQTTVIKEEKTVPTQTTAQFPWQGTIRRIELEGGFWGIETEQGEKILPLNLNDILVIHQSKFTHNGQLLINGAKVQFSGDYVENTFTIQQWGRPFNIGEIVVVEFGKP